MQSISKSNYYHDVMTITITLQILAGVLLLAANAFFVSIEFALTRLRQYDEAEITNDPRLRQAWEMTEKLEIHLTGCQVGITSTSILLGVIAEPGVTKLINMAIPAGIGSFSSHGISIFLSLLVINFAHTVWGEQAPTYLGVERSKQIARYFARPLHWWTILIRPVLIAGDWLTKATLKAFGVEMTRSWTQKNGDESPKKQTLSRASLKNQIADFISDKGLPKDRQEEIINTAAMGEIPVKKIMIPREKITSLSTKNDFLENLLIVKDTLKNRYPLVGSDLDDFIGILYTPEILANISELQRGTMVLDDLDHYNMRLPAKLKVSEVIDRFQSNKQELALVVEKKKVIGLVTLTDAVEVIIGSAQDPTDQEE